MRRSLGNTVQAMFIISHAPKSLFYFSLGYPVVQFTLCRPSSTVADPSENCTPARGSSAAAAAFNPGSFQPPAFFATSYPPSPPSRPLAILQLLAGPDGTQTTTDFPRNYNCPAIFINCEEPGRRGTRANEKGYDNWSRRVVS